MIKKLTRYIFGLLFILAGMNHFINKGFYLKIVPNYLPWHSFLVASSGIVEIALGALLLFRKYKKQAAWGLIALLIAVFPANIHMAINSSQFPEFAPIGLWLRLPVQGVLILWAYWYTQRDSPSDG